MPNIVINIAEINQWLSIGEVEVINLLNKKKVIWKVQGGGGGTIGSKDFSYQKYFINLI